MNDFMPNVDRAKKLLRACPTYKASPLIETKEVADIKLLIKDETQRMGLGSFKALGGVYAVAIILADKWQEKTGKDLKAEQYITEEFKKFASSFTFVCASAGNHGLAVASGAKLFGANARIHLSAEVPKTFEQHLLAKNATVVWSGKVYDDSVDAAKKDVFNSNEILLADGSWEGYCYAPSLVMEGYTVIGEELRIAFSELNKWPTHIFIQAGVGGLAAALSYMIRFNWEHQPEIFIVESDQAPCLQESRHRNVVTTVSGGSSIMGRLDCKAPSLLAFNSLEKMKVNYLIISDKEAINATEMLQQRNIHTTPSGAAGFAGLLKYKQRKAAIHAIASNSFNPLVIITEGKI